MSYISEEVRNSGMQDIINKQKKDFLNSRIETLNNLIEADIKREKDSLRLNVLLAIKKMPTWNEELFDAKNFVYNNGKFRSEEEIEKYDKMIESRKSSEIMRRECEENKRYFESGQYDEECSKGSFAVWLPFIINVVLLIISVCDMENQFNFMLFLINISPVSLIISVILAKCHASKCEKLAIEHKVPATSITYQRSINAIKTLDFCSVLGAISLYHSISGNIKQTLDPDTWPGV